MADLKQPRVLIVGASRGIGLEFVRQYRADGAAVSATARDDAGLARISELGAQALRLDVAASDAELRLPDWAAAGAPFDIVVHNAGIYGPRRETPTPAGDDFDAVMRTNVLGAMRVLPSLAGALADGARLAVISSRMGSIASRDNATGTLYRASKAALNSVLKDAATSLAGRAVCVALHPGWVRTDMGGSGAALEVADSVASLRRTIAGLRVEDNASFFDHDGSPIAW